MMVESIRNKRKTTYAAFTVAELILIIVVIGILMALAVIGLGAWQARVARTAIKSDIAHLQASMQDVRNRTNAYPVFPGGTKFVGGGVASSVFVQSEDVEITYVSGNTTDYCVNAQSLKVSSVQMYLNTAGGNATAQDGTC